MSLIHQSFPMRARRRAQAWRYQPAYRRPWHFHEESEFNLVARGWGVFTVGAHVVPVTPGQILWFPPGLDHYLLDASDDLELLVVGYGPAILAAVAREHGVTPSFARALEQVDERRRDGMSEALRSASLSPDDLAVEQRLVRLLGELETPAPQPLGHRTAACLLARPDAGRDELARCVASNRGDVSRCLRKDHGLSLSDYRNRLRILRFIRVVETGERNLLRAALDAGFGSYSQCHRVFCSLLGQSPSEHLRAGPQHDVFEPLPRSVPASSSSCPTDAPPPACAGLRYSEVADGASAFGLLSTGAQPIGRVARH